MKKFLAIILIIFFVLILTMGVFLKLVAPQANTGIVFNIYTGITFFITILINIAALEKWIYKVFEIFD